MGRGAVAIGAVMIVAGGAALGYALTRKAQGQIAPKATEAMQAATSQLDLEITKARTSLRSGVEKLSTDLQVKVAVVGDVGTAIDAKKTGDLNLAPGAGEVIELGNIVEGKTTTLLVEPEGAKSKNYGGVFGTYVDLDDQQLWLGEVVEVIPQSDDKTATGKQIKGYLAGTKSLDLAPMIAKLEEAGIDGRLENMAASGKQSRAIGSPRDGAKTMARPLPAQTSFSIIVDVPGAKPLVPKGIVGAGAGVAALGLVLIVLGMMRKRDPEPRRHNIQSMETVPSGPQAVSPNAPTKFSAQHAVGTPSPVDSASTTNISPANLGPGAMIGRWEVIRRLGSGGMADVYLAHSKGEAGFEKLVAIKVMHPHLARNQRAVDHFLDEAKLAARISHPNVVAIQDLGKIGNDYVIVMDYVEGVDLERLLASARLGGRPVPIDVSLGILCRICDGLNAAHRAIGPDGVPLGIIHRDVKSANVLVSRQGGVKVVDFGIAKATKQIHMTQAGETKGTPSMMAPEQRVGEQVDVRADVYSVAAVGFEILTGHAVNLDLAALAHLGVENWPHLPLPSSMRAQMPQELDGILLGAMSFEREKRPADCAAFEEIFERVMKAYNLQCSDKDIARWVESEISLLVPAFQGGTTTVSRPAGAS